MPLPDGDITVNGGGTEPKTGMIMKIPHDLWLLFEKAAKDSSGRFKVSLEDGFRLIQPNGEIVSLGVHTTGISSEIHSVDAIRAALQPVALASARLSVPIAAPKSKTQAKGDKVVKPAPLAKPVLPAKSVTSLANAAATFMSRTQSTPVGAGTTSSTTAATATAAITAGATAASPKVPLKTRVIQLLASGDYTAEAIAAKVDAPVADTMRVVNVHGRTVPGHPNIYGLRPADYAKVKFTDWPYTRLERKVVIQRARRAFDGLGLALNSDEYMELERKIKESTPVDTSPSGSSTKSGFSVRDMPPIKKLTPEEQVEQAKMLAKHNANSLIPPAPAPAPAPYSKPVKGRAQKSLIGKERDKHRAEKRGSSNPLPPAKTGVTAHSAKSDKKPVKSAMSRAKAYYTSSSSSEDDQPAKKLAHKRKSSTPPIKTPAHVPAVTTHVPAAAAPSKRSNPSDDDISPPKRFKHLPDRPLEDCPEMIPDEDPLRAEPLQRQRTATLSRSQSKSTEAARGNWSNASSPPPKSQQEMRERYDELYPAYVLLSEKLRSAYQTVGDPNNLPEVMPYSEEDLGELMAKFHRWHAELERIRIAFREGSP